MYILFNQTSLIDNKKNSSFQILKNKTKREKSNPRNRGNEENEDKNDKNSKQEDNNLLNKNYISLFNHKNVSLCNKLNCQKRNLSKNEYNKIEYFFEMKKIFNKNEKSFKIKKIKIISFDNKNLLFILTDNDLLIYEMHDNSSSLSFIKTISQKEIFYNGDIKYYYIFLYKNKILFNFINYRQIKLYLYDLNNNEFILRKIKDYCKDNSNKYFYYLKRNDKFIIFKCDEAVIYNSILTEFKTLISLEEDFGADSIRSCKELNSNILCFIFSYSISLYNFTSDKFIGNISGIFPNSVKLIENNKKSYIMILTLNEINLYELEQLSFVEKLKTNKLKNIRKIKQLSNLDLAIIYGEYNLALYDLKYNIIKYQIQNEGIKTNYYNKYFYLKHINNNIVIYNPTRYSLNIIDCIKGQAIAKFSDGLNKIQKCQKINVINFNRVYNDDYLKLKKYFYFIINTKGYFILKINDS